MMRLAHRRLAEGAFLLLLALGAWFLRAERLNQFVTWDEPMWAYRSVRFLLALLRGDPAGTLLVGHPGVTTMWCGALGLAWHTFVLRSISLAQLAAIDAWASLDVHDPVAMGQLVALLPAAKAALPIVHAGITIAGYLLLRRLLGRPYAIVAALLLLLDPYHLALSRVLHMDALAANWMLLSFVSMVLFMQQRSRGYLIGSGLASALAVLTKSYALLALPFMGALLAYSCLRPVLAEPAQATRQRGARALSAVRPLLRPAALWGGTIIGTFVLLWPAMWVNPLKVVTTMLGLSLEYAAKPGEATASFFWGATTLDPGLAFYPVVMLFRSTPLLWLGCALCLGQWVYGLVHRRAAPVLSGRAGVPAIAYALLYLALISLSRKKFDRYMLPALLSLDLAAAVGLAVALRWIAAALHRRGVLPSGGTTAVATMLGVLVVCGQAGLLLGPLYPAHYLAYANPWMGGPSRALATIPIGWGEGVEQAAQYLARKPDASALTVSTWCVASLVGVFPGRVMKPSMEAIYAADYTLAYVGDTQTGESALTSLPRSVDAEYTTSLNGLTYTWVYPNPQPARLAAQLEEMAGQVDLIVTNAQAAFQRHYRGQAPVVVVNQEREGLVADQLQAACRGAQRVLYLEFAGPHRGMPLAVGRQLAQRGLLLWQSAVLDDTGHSYGQIFCYLLPDKVRFAPVQLSPLPDTRFGALLALDAVGVSSETVEYRQEVGLAMVFRALAPMNQDYHLFVDLLDDEGRVWGKRDQPLQDDDSARTSAWAPGSLHTCRTSLALQPGLPPGPYRLRYGLYSLQGMARLEVFQQERPAGGVDGPSIEYGPLLVLPATVPPRVDDLPISRRLDEDQGGPIRLIGLDSPDGQQKSGDQLATTLYWQCLSRTDTAYEVILRLRDDAGVVQTFSGPPAGRHYPTNQWREGDVLRYPQKLTLASDLPSGRYYLYANLCDPSSADCLWPRDVLLTELAIERRERLYTVPVVEFPMAMALGGKVEILGYDLAEKAASPGGTLHVTLYWRALRPDGRDYKVFVHLLDEAGVIRGQRDSEPVGGQRPTSGWVAGEIVVDRYEVGIDPRSPSGTYHLAIGMYDAASGARLEMAGSAGSTISDQRALLPQTIAIR